MAKSRIPVTCEGCYENPAVIQIVLGLYYPQACPVCKECAKDALNNPNDWAIYVPTTLETRAEIENA